MKSILAKTEFSVDHAADGRLGWQMVLSRDYASAILDLGLPGLAGLEVLKRWREAGKELPVMILSARGGWAERVNGLNCGADDYLEKPFQGPELVARLRSLLRRTRRNSSSVLQFGQVELDTATGTVKRNGAPVEITVLESRVLNHLSSNLDRVVPQAELINHVYADDGARASNTVEVYIARLRKKLGREIIRTVRGMGYRMSRTDVFK